MSFFRSYIAPFLIVLTFLIAMLAVSARIFLPSDMMAPAPIEEPVGQTNVGDGQVSKSHNEDAMPAEIAWLLKGLPDGVHQG